MQSRQTLPRLQVTVSACAGRAKTRVLANNIVWTRGCRPIYSQSSSQCKLQLSAQCCRANTPMIVVSLYFWQDAPCCKRGLRFVIHRLQLCLKVRSTGRASASSRDSSSYGLRRQLPFLARLPAPRQRRLGRHRCWLPPQLQRPR